MREIVTCRRCKVSEWLLKRVNKDVSTVCNVNHRRTSCTTLIRTIKRAYFISVLEFLQKVVCCGILELNARVYNLYMQDTMVLRRCRRCPSSRRFQLIVHVSPLNLVWCTGARLSRSVHALKTNYPQGLRMALGKHKSVYPSGRTATSRPRTSCQYRAKW